MAAKKKVLVEEFGKQLADPSTPHSALRKTAKEIGNFSGKADKHRRAPLPNAASGYKETNPKDALAGDKLALHLVPDTLAIYAAIAFTEGASKYGSHNWMRGGATASVYKSALERHTKGWWNGEEVDPKTGVPHLAGMAACVAVIIDATVRRNLDDDRPPALSSMTVAELLDWAADKANRVKRQLADKKPHHHREKE